MSSVLGGGKSGDIPEFPGKEADAVEAAALGNLRNGKIGTAKQVDCPTHTVSFQILEYGFSGVLFKKGAQIIGVQMHMIRHILQGDLLGIMHSDIVDAGKDSVLVIVASLFLGSEGGAVRHQADAEGHDSGKQLSAVFFSAFLLPVQHLQGRRKDRV